jgi:hypothetical protein
MRSLFAVSARSQWDWGSRHRTQDHGCLRLTTSRKLSLRASLARSDSCSGGSFVVALLTYGLNTSSLFSGSSYPYELCRVRRSMWPAQEARLTTTTLIKHAHCACKCTSNAQVWPSSTMDGLARLYFLPSPLRQTGAVLHHRRFAHEH